MELVGLAIVAWLVFRTGEMLVLSVSSQMKGSNGISAESSRVPKNVGFSTFSLSPYAASIVHLPNEIVRSHQSIYG